MHNSVILLGRIARDIEVIDKNKANIVLATQRQYKNEEGIYETDFIPCTLTGNIAMHTQEYCKKGDLVAIKGRLEMVDEKLNIVTEKISFLSSRTSEEGENNNE